MSVRVVKPAPSPPGANWSTPGLGTRQTPPLNPQTNFGENPPSARAFALSPLKVVGGLLVSSTCPNWKSKKVVGLKVWKKLATYCLAGTSAMLLKLALPPGPICVWSALEYRKNTELDGLKFSSIRQ